MISSWVVTLFVNVRDHSIKLQIGYFYIKQHYTDFAQLAQNVTGQIEIFEASFSTSISTNAAQQGGKSGTSSACPEVQV